MTSTHIGKVIDNYRILENLGTGGMGVVYKAIHIKLEKLFALKMIAPGLVMNERFIQRFQTEARALARLEDPNIVRIYDLRSYQDQWFIVMEYVEGITLLDKIKNDGALPWHEAIPLLKQMLTAISHAHNVGIIHRDIKPNNIMLTTSGAVKITDFGLAKDQTTPGQTHTIASGGTLYYMSPEHVKGFSFIDKRSDIYSIGMTFYEMITGSVPFKDLNSDFDIRETIVRKPFKKPTAVNPNIPAGLEKIVMAAIAKNPEHRYQSADEMTLAIKDFESNALPLLRSDGNVPGKNPPERPTLRLAQSRYLWPVLTVLGIFLMFYMGSRHFQEPGSTTGKGVATISDSSRLSVRTTPTATVYLNEDSIGRTPVRGYPLSAGGYKLRLSAADFTTIDTAISLLPDSTLDLVFSLSPDRPQTASRQNSPPPVRTGTRSPKQGFILSVQSIPSRAEVWIDQKYYGKTPLDISRLSPGSHELRVVREGNHEYKKLIQLRAGNPQIITANLSPATGGFLVTTVPESVTVKLDGKPLSMDKSPFSRADVTVGKHQLEITRAGYSHQIRELEIRLDEIARLDVQLSRLTGMLSVQVKPWGSIYLDDQLKKESTDLKFEIELPVEKYHLRVVHPTLGQWEKHIEIEKDSRKELLVDFSRELTVKIVAFDEEGNEIAAEIVLDQQPSGLLTPAEFRLRIGLHDITVKKDGFNTQNQKFLVDNETDRSRHFILKKLESSIQLND